MSFQHAMSLRIIFSTCFLALFTSIKAQELVAIHSSDPSGVYNISINCWCPECNVDTYLSVTVPYLNCGATHTPNGNFFVMDDNNDIWQVDPNTGAYTLVVDMPHHNDYFDLQGLAAGSDNILYAINRVPPTDTLLEINIVTDTWTALGTLTEDIHNLGDMSLYEGELYYISGNANNGISRIILGTPIINELVVDLPPLLYHALTTSTQCHSFFSYETLNEHFVLINTIDGDVTVIGNNFMDFFWLSSLLEFQTPGCVTSIDLDCNNSSGAPGYDYSSIDYTCVSENGVTVTDYDLLFLYDTLVEQMTIELTGFLPDGNNEYLELEQTFPNLMISGSGTQTILIESDGLASSTQFKSALRQIRYHNSSFIPTPGGRTVYVNAVTYYGTPTNQAAALINVVEWPSYELELGPDIQLCEEQEMMLNTQLEDVDHLWSTNETTQSITVSDPGTYSVTVTGDEFCPAIDSIEISVVPNIFVELGNDMVVCDGEEVTIEVTVDSPYPLTIGITVTPGSPISLTGVINTTEISVIASEFTNYLINSVTSPQPACIEIGDEEQYIDIIPSYNDTLANEICEGDSLLIGNTWIYDPGVYTEHSSTFFGCDSIVTHHVSFSNSISVFQEINTCIVADTGTFFQLINNPVGCDTLLETHVQLGLLDTTFLLTSTCRTGQQGIYLNVFTSAGGCDSVVVNTILLIAPQDTLLINQTSCDSSTLGVFQNIYVNQDGCDSLVINTVSFGSPDTTFLFNTSCDSSSLGIFEDIFQNQFSCDSVVITTITYSSQDSVFISGSTCNAADSGTFVSHYSNIFGCDSIVTTIVNLLSADESFVTSATCDPT